MKEENKRLDNTIKIVADVLEKYKNKDEIKKPYKNIYKLKEKRNIR